MYWKLDKCIDLDNLVELERDSNYVIIYNNQQRQPPRRHSTAVEHRCQIASNLINFFNLVSVRLGSKHNVRASILASSICLETASSRGGSIKSVPAAR